MMVVPVSRVWQTTAVFASTSSLEQDKKRSNTKEIKSRFGSFVNILNDF
jgi:hypothetical protein